MNKPLFSALRALLVVAAAGALIAQSPGSGPGGGGGPEGGGQRQPPPLINALDANHDGVIDAAEIANAPAALKKLDKNGDGKLTMDEFRPPRPQGESGGGGPQGGPPGGNR